mmetsp:Transcript_21180/g.50353  ORF Transcript_21180/g.50353 Transcript_21180/m.50353 type:complete len:150 (-) Transcript_21180:2097-2546(-)
MISFLCFVGILSTLQLSTHVLALSEPLYPTILNGQGGLGRRAFLNAVAVSTVALKPSTVSATTSSPSVQDNDVQWDDIDSIISDQVNAVVFGGRNSAAGGSSDPKNVRSDKDDEKVERPEEGRSSLPSDIDEALKSSIKRRQVDPRTHG